jgi:hypothetical protein
VICISEWMGREPGDQEKALADREETLPEGLVTIVASRRAAVTRHERQTDRGLGKV